MSGSIGTGDKLPRLVRREVLCAAKRNPAPGPVTTRPATRRKTRRRRINATLGGNSRRSVRGARSDPRSCSRTVSIAEVDRRRTPVCLPSKVMSLEHSGSAALSWTNEGEPRKRGADGRSGESEADRRKPARRWQHLRERWRAPHGAPVDGRRLGAWKPRPLTGAWEKRSWPFGSISVQRGPLTRPPWLVQVDPGGDRGRQRSSFRALRAAE